MDGDATATKTCLHERISPEGAFTLQGCPQKLYNKINQCQKQSNLVYISLETVIPLKELNQISMQTMRQSIEDRKKGRIFSV